MSIPAEPVLIVDDDLASCRFMAEVLAGAGYRVEWTTDDDGALERVHRSPYSLVIADVTMPGVSGNTRYGLVPVLSLFEMPRAARLWITALLNESSQRDPSV